MTKKWLYLYDGWDIIGVMNGNGQLLETFTRGEGLAGDIGTLVAVTHHAGSGVTPGTYYLHHNHRGDVVLSRSGTTTVGSYAYSAFGILHSSLGTDASRFKFSSKEREASCGFSYYGYRFYAPQWQRWPNPDPNGEGGGINLYRFVRNNPVDSLDPTGAEDKPGKEGKEAIKAFLEGCAKAIYEQHKTEINKWLKDHPEATAAGVAAYIAYQWGNGNKLECPAVPVSKSCEISAWIQPKKGGCGVDGGGIKICIKF